MAFCACGFVASASARECAKLEEEKTEEEEEKEEQLPVPQASLTTLKSSLTLRQMIQLGWSMCISEMCVRGGVGVWHLLLSVFCTVRDTSAELSSTHDVLKAAPESAIARRRRLRAERQAAALLFAEQERQGGGEGPEGDTGQERSDAEGCHQPLCKERTQLGVAFVLDQGAPQGLKVVRETEELNVVDGVEVLPNLSVSKDSITESGRRRSVQLVPVITDTRPVVPSLVSSDAPSLSAHNVQHPQMHPCACVG